MKRTTKQLFFWLSIAALCAASVVAAGCGKRGAPVPPRERVKQRAEISGFQRGNQVLLSWEMPARNAPAGNVQHIARIDVHRLAEPLTAPQQITEETFADRSTIIATIPVKDDDFGLKKLQYRDPLEFAGQAVRIRYAIRFVNAQGQKAAFSNTLLIEPASKIADPPSSLTGEVKQESIDLKWQPPLKNIDGSTPVSILGYNVYRSEAANVPGKLLNKSPIVSPSFRDEFFQFGKEYFYFVRAVSAGLEAAPVESLESNILKLTPIDTFAPTPPSALTVAAAPGTISIFFAVNPEKDIAGYKIYRTTDESEDKAKWQLITPELLKTNTFQDTKVESGKKYFYYVTATDTTGNVSERSEVVSETVP